MHLESPYDSAWASVILRDQFKIEMKKINHKRGAKWMVTKLKGELSEEV